MNGNLDNAEAIPDEAEPSFALVIEDDTWVTQVCSRELSRLGMLVSVVTTPKAALAALAKRGTPLAFVYADAQLLAGTCAAAAAEIRRRRPETRFVLASREIGDILRCDGVVICKSFDRDQFQAAFDGSRGDEEYRRLALAAAEDDGAGNAAEAVVAGARRACSPRRRMRAMSLGA
jgi:CheY-like chemotaxis protein